MLNAPTAVNQTLKPKTDDGTDDDINLGASTNQWSNIYFRDHLYLNGKPTMYMSGELNNNFYVGPYAGSHHSFTSGNTGVGMYACYVWESKNNTAIGYSALGGGPSYGSDNTATGI